MLKFGAGFLFALVGLAYSLPEPGRWTLHLNSTQTYGGVAKTVYQGTKVYINIQCSTTSPQKLNIGWMIRESNVLNVDSNIIISF